MIVCRKLGIALGENVYESPFHILVEVPFVQENVHLLGKRTRLVGIEKVLFAGLVVDDCVSHGCVRPIRITTDWEHHSKRRHGSIRSSSSRVLLLLPLQRQDFLGAHTERWLPFRLLWNVVVVVVRLMVVVVVVEKVGRSIRMMGDVQLPPIPDPSNITASIGFHPLLLSVSKATSDFLQSVETRLRGATADGNNSRWTRSIILRPGVFWDGRVPKFGLLCLFPGEGEISREREERGEDLRFKPSSLVGSSFGYFM